MAEEIARIACEHTETVRIIAPVEMPEQEEVDEEALVDQPGQPEGPMDDDSDEPPTLVDSSDDEEAGPRPRYPSAWSARPRQRPQSTAAGSSDQPPAAAAAAASSTGRGEQPMGEAVHTDCADVANRCGPQKMCV